MTTISAAGDRRHVYGDDIGQIAAQSVQDLALASNAADQDMISRGPRGDRVKQRVVPHLNALGNKNILGAAIGGIAGELAERTLRLAHVIEDLAFDDDLRALGHLQLGRAAAGDPVGLAE
jgi:hypothetical protein